jgi:hypothetical protein
VSLVWLGKHTACKQFKNLQSLYIVYKNFFFYHQYFFYFSQTSKPKKKQNKFCSKHNNKNKNLCAIKQKKKSENNNRFLLIYDFIHRMCFLFESYLKILSDSDLNTYSITTNNPRSFQPRKVPCENHTTKRR